jgi:hypothetical protein
MRCTRYFFTLRPSRGTSKLLGKLRNRPIALDGRKRHLRLEGRVWFRRGRLDMLSPDSQAIACLPSGRNSTYRLFKIPEPAQ